MNDREKKIAFGRRVRAIRETLGLSRELFGARLGVSATTIKNVELGCQNLGGAATAMLETVAASTAGLQPGTGLSCAESAAPWPGGRGGPAGLTVAQAADLVEAAEALREQAAAIAAITGESTRAALEHAIEARLRSGRK